MVIHLLLYGTDGCHLCEEAARLVHEALSEYDVTVQEIDIVEDSALLNRYGQRIPVIRRVGAMEELSWPFDRADLVRLARTRPFA
ncbi:MAG: glutaredoxin family protein [Ectothiorhodospiraceae bacterium]|nr:glutaredoxin family protein [Ectothiorhodospiraceae bacterium]